VKHALNPRPLRCREVSQSNQFDEAHAKYQAQKWIVSGVTFVGLLRIEHPERQINFIVRAADGIDLT
jgi:hypothetical protein